MSKKKNGIFSIFRRSKSKESSASITSESSSKLKENGYNEDGSFSEINRIIPSTPISYRSNLSSKQASDTIKNDIAVPTPETTEISKAVKTKKSKSKLEENSNKKYSPAPGPPALSIDVGYEERAVDVKSVDNFRTTTTKKILQTKEEPKPTKVLSDNQQIKKDLDIKILSPEMVEVDEARGRSSTSCSNSSQNSTSSMIQAGVIHYSPHGTTRSSSALSPEPISDVPHIERHSNIQLNDEYKLNSISVTRYDGRPKQRAPLPPTAFQPSSPVVSSPKKRLAPPPPPSVAPPSIPTPIESPKTEKPVKPLTINTEPPKRTEKKEFIAATSTGIKKLSPSLRGAPTLTKKEELLQKKYEALENKFTKWKDLKSIYGETVEVKHLQNELYRDHDEVMCLVKDSGLYWSDTMSLKGAEKKKRPSLAADTFQPRFTTPVRSPLSIVPSQQTINSFKPSPISSPGTSRCETPKSSSISPTASEDSADSGVVKGNSPKLPYRSPAPKNPTVDINQNIIRKSKQPRTIEEEKAKAMNRITEEAKDLYRKEEELKKSSASSVIPVTYSKPEVVETKTREIPKKSPTTPRAPPPSAVTSPNLKRDNINTKPKYHVYRSPLEIQSPIMKSAATSPTPPPIPTTPVPPMNKRSSQVAVNSVLIDERPKIPSNKTNSPRLPHDSPKLPSPRIVDPVKRPTTFVFKNQMSPSITTVPTKYFDTPVPSNSKNTTTVTVQKTPKLETPPPPIVPLHKRYTSDKTVTERVEVKNVDIIRTGTSSTTIEIGRNVEKSSNVIIEKTRNSPNFSNQYKNNNNISTTPNKYARKTMSVSSEEDLSDNVILKKTTITSNEAELTKKPLKEFKRMEPETLKKELTNNLKKKNAQSSPTTVEAEIAHNFPTLRSVGPPKEKHGITFGRVIETPPSTSKSPTSTPVAAPKIPNAPPPPPSPLSIPSATPPPPPPPPPPMLFQRSESTPVLKKSTPSIANVPSSPTTVPPLINSQDLINQKERLKKTSPVEKKSPLASDMVGNLMEEIRKSGGINSLKKISA